MKSKKEIGTRQLADDRWEAFYIEPGVNSDMWNWMEGRTEEDAIKNLKEKHGK